MCCKRVLKIYPFSNQYCLRGHTERYMAVPAVYASYLIMVEPEFPFGSFEVFLDCPASSSSADDLLRINVGFTKGKEVLDVLWIFD